MAKKVYNRIYTKEKWEQVNKYNKQVLEDYILQAKSEGKSKGSITQYYADGRIIMILIMELFDNKPLHKFTRKMVRNLILHFQSMDHSPARINRLLSTFRNIMNFGMEGDEDYEEDFENCKLNPSRVKGLKKEERREIVFLTMEEVNAIYDRLIRDENYQDATLLGLLIDSACRRNEAYQVEKDSIKEDGNFTNIVIGKRGKKFPLMYNEMTKKAHKLYMQQRGEDNIKSLWITGSGDEKEPCSYETLYYRIISWRKLLEEETGIYKEFNVHSMRHSCLNLLSIGEHYICKQLGDKKFELNELKLLANHESIETTNSYLEDRSEELLLSAFGIK